MHSGGHAEKKNKSEAQQNKRKNQEKVAQSDEQVQKKRKTKHEDQWNAALGYFRQTHGKQQSYIQHWNEETNKWNLVVAVTSSMSPQRMCLCETLLARGIEENWNKARFIQERAAVLGN